MAAVTQNVSSMGHSTSKKNVGANTQLTSFNLIKLISSLPQPYETSCYKYRPGDDTFMYEESEDGDCPPLSYSQSSYSCSTNPSTRSNSSCVLGNTYALSNDYYSGRTLDVPQKKKSNDNATTFLMGERKEEEHEMQGNGCVIVDGNLYYEEEEDEEQLELERRMAAKFQAEREAELALAKKQNALEEERAADRREHGLDEYSDDDADCLFDDIEHFAKENREAARKQREAMLQGLDLNDEGEPAVRWMLGDRQPFDRSPQVTWDLKHSPCEPDVTDEAILEAERAPIQSAESLIKGPWLTKDNILTEDESLWEPWNAMSRSTSCTSSADSVADSVFSEFNVSARTRLETTDDLVNQVFNYLHLDQDSQSNRFDGELAWNNRWPQKYVAENRFDALKDYIQRYIERNPEIAKGDPLW